MRHALWWLVALAGLLAAAAPDRALAETVITETELLAALDTDRASRAVLNAAVEVERAGVLLAGRLEAPSLGTTREDTGDAGIEWTWTARWAPPLPGRRRRFRDQARAALDLAVSEAAMARLHLRLTLRGAFAEWALAHERGRLAEAFAQEIEALAKIEAARAHAGEAAGLAARRLALASQRAALEAEKFAAAALRARGHVASLVDGLPGTATPRLPLLPPLPAGQEGTRPDGHPRLLAAAAEVTRDRLSLDLDRKSVAAPEIEVGWKQVRAGDLDADGPVLGASWSVPLPGRRKALAAAGEAVLAGSQARRTRRELEVTSTRAATQAAYVRLFAATSRPPARNDEIRYAAAQAYRLGEGSLTDLLDTLNAVHGAALGDLDLLAHALAVHRSLELAVGHPLETTP